MRTEVVAPTAQTGRRERPYSSPRRFPPVQQLVDTSSARAARPGPAATSPTTRTGDAAPPPSGDTAPPTGANPPGTAGPDDTGLLPKVVSRRRRGLLALLGLVAALAAGGLVLGLLSWSPDPPDRPRPLTVAESERLAAMRVTNYRDLRAGLHVTVGTDGARTELVGWVDWSRPLLYLDVGGPGAGAERGLLQATPTVLLIRPDPTAVPTAAPPPLVPPADRWRLHDLPAGSTLRPVLDLLFRLAADRPEPAAALREGARWVARETVTAGPVDVLAAPLPTSTIAGAPTTGGPDEQPRYWVDQDARLHRLTARLPGAGPVTVTLNRTDRPTLRPVDALGGRQPLPRGLTAAERARLDGLRARLVARGGATVTLTAPAGRETNLRGAGWLSWTGRSAYLAVADLGVPERRTLLRRDAGGWSRAEVAATGDPEKPERPPLPPPAGAAWRAGRAGPGELTALVDAALTAARTAPTGAVQRLREDTLGGRTVDVVELRSAGNRVRYWVDRAGLLRRVELQTRAGAWAQLEVSPGPTPRLPAPKRPATAPAR
ncbi:hypothetical protein [Micromonospora sp. WMMD812]|uniref:hypothetical protein n=1 Tax=Micromonospora sp. WMMD812 TaxID=3015152 RepID=UPI00248CA848|nr:hypothetical protein [Micromonospora sp. WMMD812]WBB67371.1 hypothetical protein O7603_30480 [Micromonospora sp. WMMD812]